MELTININGKDIKVKDLLDALFKIRKIVNNECPYCDRNNINNCEDKLKLIGNIIDGVLNGKEDS